MAANRITFRMLGPDEDKGDVRFEDFIRQLDAVKKALLETERILEHEKSVYYRIVALSHSSPTELVLEGVPKQAGVDPGEIFDALVSGVTYIQEKSQAPPNFDYDALQSYKEMTDLLGERITEFTVSLNGTTLPISETLARNVDVILGPDRFEVGSATGLLETINLYRGKNVFFLYPTSRHRKLRCVFPQDLRQKAIDAVGEYINVSGRFKYKAAYDYPYEIQVQDIEIYPDEGELPTLNDLRGIAPNATGDKSSEEFIRDLRDEW